MSIRDKLRLIRYEEHWGQEEAARECGISYSLWTKIEGGFKDDPKLSTLVKIAARTRKSLDWLVDYHPDWRRIFRDHSRAGGH